RGLVIAANRVVAVHERLVDLQQPLCRPVPLLPLARDLDLRERAVATEQLDVRAPVSAFPEVGAPGRARALCSRGPRPYLRQSPLDHSDQRRRHAAFTHMAVAPVHADQGSPVLPLKVADGVTTGGLTIVAGAEDHWRVRRQAPLPVV